METSQHNPYESESQGSMNVNEVAMPQYKPSEVTMLQDKSESIANERATPQIKRHLKNNHQWVECVPMQSIE